jgi:hypothetical protein
MKNKQIGATTLHGAEAAVREAAPVFRSPAGSEIPYSRQVERR